MKKRRFLPFLPLAFIFILGLLFRLRHWPDYLTFDYEKARDLIASLNIYLNRKPTLIGPTAEVEGIFHGPLYYYLVGLVYYFFKGDPRAGSIISFGFNLAGILVIYYIGKKLFTKKIGLISAFLYAVSFEAISYAYWLSNPGPSVPFLFLTFFFFFEFLKGKEKYLLLSLFCWGISIQFQILNVIFIFSLVLLFLFDRSEKTKFNFKTIILSAFTFFIPISSFFLFELRHQLLMTNVFVKNYFLSPSTEKFNLILILRNYFPRFLSEFSYVFLPSSRILSLYLLLAFLGYFFYLLIKDVDRRQLWFFLFVWTFSTFPIFFINSRMSESQAAFIGVSAALILIAANFINEITNRKKILIFPILVIIAASNLFAVDNYLTDPGKRLFDFFQGQFLKIDLAVVDYTYQETDGKPFQVDTVTSPLYISKLWDYLYEWRGKTKYHYLPLRDNKVRNYYLILEPQVDDYFKKIAKEKNLKFSKYIDSKKIGSMVIERWESY